MGLVPDGPGATQGARPPDGLAHHARDDGAMMRAWGLYSSRVDMYSAHELIEVFSRQEVAETVRANLIGKRIRRELLDRVWEDDEDFPDLYVRPLEVRA